jgi:isoquinoline 1-oxidoreductase subunit beta
MSTLQNPSRRGFVQGGAAAAGGLASSGLLVGCAMSPDKGPMAAAMGNKKAMQAAALPPSASAPGTLTNAWVKVGADNAITIICGRVEMGQGTFTAMPMLVAEELGVDVNSVRVEMAPAAEPYINTMLGGQLTGGSTSVREAYDKLRVAGAQARLMLVSAAAARWKVDPASCTVANAVITGPAGQKLTFGDVANDAAKLKPPQNPKLKATKDFKALGTWVKRLDSPTKVDGSAEYGIDAKLPGMLYAALAQCPVIGGKPVSFDGATARTMPGVKHVVQISDGVAVVADTYWRAQKALGTVKIVWNEGAGKTLSSASVAAALKTASAAPGAEFRKVGDADGAMAKAAKKVEAVYELPFLAHAPLEPMNFTADVRKDACVLYGPTQFPQAAVGTAAAITGLKPEQISVRTTFLGGGFGRRIDSDFIAQAVEISKAVAAPVKLVWTREADMKHDFYRPISRHTLTAGLDAAGMPTAMKVHLTSPSVTQRLFTAFVKDGIDPFMLEAAVLPYDIPNQTGRAVIHDTGLRVGYWRSVSHALNVFANESFMDELALAAGKDPVAYRRSLLAKEPRYLAVLNKVVAESGWGNPTVAGRSRGIAIMEGYGTYLGMVSEVSVEDKKIRVHKITIAADMGAIVNANIVAQQIEGSTIFGLSSTLYGEITLKDGVVEQSNFNDYPVVRMNDSPVIDVHMVASSDAPGGIGEPLTALIGPCVANAVFAASGQRLRKMPLRLA